MSLPIVLPLALLAAAIYLVALVRSIVLPFVLAAALAYLLNPLVDFFRVRGFRRPPVVLGVFLTFFSGVSVVTYLAVSAGGQEAVRAAINMPSYVQKGQNFITQESKNWQKSSGLPKVLKVDAFLEEVAEKGRSWPAKILENMPKFAFQAIPFFEFAFLVPFVAFFIMLEGPRWIEQFFSLIPSAYVEMSLNILVEFDNSLGNYLRGLFIEASLVSVLAWVGFAAIGLDYSMQIAILVGLTNVIPFVGPVVGGVVGGMVALFQWGGIFGVLKVFAVCALIRFSEDWFINPLVLKRAVDLHPVLVVFSLMAGAELWGFWGMLFAIPVMCLIKVFLQVLWQWYHLQRGQQANRLAYEVAHIPLI
jgi:predicted PurR-regulated permease PerM